MRTQQRFPLLQNKRNNSSAPRPEFVGSFCFFLPPSPLLHPFLRFIHLQREKQTEKRERETLSRTMEDTVNLRASTTTSPAPEIPNPDLPPQTREEGELSSDDDDDVFFFTKPYLFFSFNFHFSILTFPISHSLTHFFSSFHCCTAVCSVRFLVIGFFFVLFGILILIKLSSLSLLPLVRKFI